MNTRHLLSIGAASFAVAWMWFESPSPVAHAATLAQIKVPSGQDLFREHCAQCHGADGTGDGPMAKILTVHPANLTAISKQAGGTFPAERIAEIIRYGGNIQGHGDQVMPIWGKVFSNEGGEGKAGGAFSRRAVIELKNYIEKIQQK
jgi:mono/diheme cytochrome c family protein